MLHVFLQGGHSNVIEVDHNELVERVMDTLFIKVQKVGIGETEGRA